MLFPSLAYRDGFRAPIIIDNLIAAGEIRPPVVCFLDLPNLFQTDREAAAKAIALELLPQLRREYHVSKEARDVTIGGFSGGAWFAALVALQYSETFGNVLSQAGAFQIGWTPNDPNVLARLYASSPKRPIRFHLSIGLYEPFRGNLPVHEAAISGGLTGNNRHFRDVLTAKGYDLTYIETATPHDSMQTRATLALALTALLKPHLSTGKR